MSYNTKNYAEQGGDVFHIGGKLIIEPGAEIEGLENLLPNGANIDAKPIMENLPESSATTVAAVRADYNALLAALKNAGIMAPDE